MSKEERTFPYFIYTASEEGEGRGPNRGVKYASPAFGDHQELQDAFLSLLNGFSLSLKELSLEKEGEVGLLLVPWHKGSAFICFILNDTGRLGCRHSSLIACLVSKDDIKRCKTSLHDMTRQIWNSNDIMGIAKHRVTPPMELAWALEGAPPQEKKYPFTTISMNFPDRETGYIFLNRKVLRLKMNLSILKPVSIKAFRLKLPIIFVVSCALIFGAFISSEDNGTGSLDLYLTKAQEIQKQFEGDFPLHALERIDFVEGIEANHDYLGERLGERLVWPKEISGRRDEFLFYTLSTSSAYDLIGRDILKERLKKILASFSEEGAAVSSIFSNAKGFRIKAPLKNGKELESRLRDAVEELPFLTPASFSHETFQEEGALRKDISLDVVVAEVLKWRSEEPSREYGVLRLFFRTREPHYGLYAAITFAEAEDYARYIPHLAADEKDLILLIKKDSLLKALRDNVKLDPESGEIKFTLSRKSNRLRSGDLEVCLDVFIEQIVEQCRKGG
ncbi:MAG: hypothetical protein IJR68_08530 [Fretibacterium sp.]|nr:hypothetical protein [Fretibacterium sp.]